MNISLPFCSNPQKITRKSILLALASFVVPLGFTHISYAGNPIISHTYTADPAARVFNGRMYVITSHDQDNATDYSSLVDYNLISSDDMVNWQDHGIVFNVRKDTKWAKLAYAPEWIFKDNKYFLFFPDGAESIGVAVADKPEGPYVDYLGKPLIDRKTPNADVKWLFDPGVFIDDDGKSYVYFGGGGPGNARVIEVSGDFKTVKGEAIKIDPPHFFEAAYVHKRNGVYYYTYSTDPDGKLSIDYMTSDKPTTGFKHKGTVLPNPWEDNNNNNHQSIVQWGEQWYIFYHNRAIANARGKSDFQRSVNVDLLSYTADGGMTVKAGREGVPQLKPFNPFNLVQAETLEKETGIEVEKSTDGALNVVFEANSWIKVAKVDFGTGAASIEFRAAAAADTHLDIILDDISRAPTATIAVKSTGGLTTPSTQTAKLSGIKGTHDVYYRAKGRLNLDWYKFSK
jgi:arabinoxylan arabinofuranohydrolase